MRKVSFEFEVSALTPFAAPLTLAASLCAPDPGISPRAELLVCLHGATCDSSYFDARFANHAGYSFAEHFSALGYHLLLLDHLGMGRSARPEPESQLHRELVAAANDHAVRSVVAGLREGRWFGAAPLCELRVSGLAHSMGGMLGIVQQARHRTFARLAVMGWSNIGVRFDGESGADAAAAVLPQGYLPAPRALMRALFHAADVPNDLIEEDDARASLTPAGLGRAAMTPGVVAAEAAQLDCPLLLLFGEVDTSPDPGAEVTFYRASPDIRLLRLRGAAHMHNYATTRTAGWQGIASWLAAG